MKLGQQKNIFIRLRSSELEICVRICTTNQILLKEIVICVSAHSCVQKARHEKVANKDNLQKALKILDCSAHLHL